MKNLINKLNKIINSQEFYEDAKKYFDYFYYENDQDEDVTYDETRQYLYYKYFKTYEEEYNSLDEAEYDFYDFVSEFYESIVNKVQDKFLKNISSICETE